MGLDQYLEIIDSENEPEEIGCWRKHPDLHSFIEQLWRSRGGVGEFNCERCELTEEDIVEIIECSEKKSFGIDHDGSRGFFWGTTHDFDHEKTVDIMEQALKLKRKGKRIAYNSSW